MSFRTITIGRSRRADLRVDDSTVSRIHAELTLTGDGRLYLIDRSSLRGTMVLCDGEWVGHRSGYVSADQPIMLGKRKIKLADELRKQGRSPRTLKRAEESA